MSSVPSKPIRSPSYPSMALRDAIDAVRKIEALYRSAPVDRADAAKLIGYSSLSGPANKALAALASYGLVERAGKGMMRVTSRARAILHANHDDERIENLRAAGLEPTLFREVMEFFEGVMPPEEGVVRYLNRQGFNSNAIRPAAKAFLETARYLEELGATESHGSARPPDQESLGSDAEDGGPTYGGARVGDLIQWESQGVLQFEQPRRVRAVHEDGQWVAVEGSQTGIRMSEVIVQERGRQGGGDVPPQFPPEDRRDDVQPQAGEVEWMRNRVGTDTNVRLLVKGDMGPKEIKKLIRLLEAQRAVLMDDEDD